MAEDPSGADFVTVSEAARRLELSERHVRRMAGRLPDTCRTDAGQGPLKVSLSALADLAGKATNAPDMGRTPAGQMPDAETGDAGHTPDILREMIERQDREIDFLRSSLEKSQALQLAALGEAAAMRGRVETLEKQNRALIEGNPMHDAETGKPHARETGETVQERPETSDGSRKTTETAGFWGRVRAFFSEGDR